MQYLSKQAQQPQETQPGKVHDPRKSKVVQDMIGDKGGLGLDQVLQLGNMSGNLNDASGMQFPMQSQMVDPGQMKHDNLMRAQTLLQAIAEKMQNIGNGQSIEEDPLLSELEQVLGAVGNEVLIDDIELLKGIYESNPFNAVGGIRRLITKMGNDIQRLLENTQQPIAATVSSKTLTKIANLKEEVRQHFNNFAVSDIQIINKLQFLNSMVDTEDSPIEEPAEYTRPKLGDEDEQFTVLHGTGGIGNTMTNAEVKAEIKELRGVLSERGYSNEEIDECVNIINANQRSQLDITDEGDLGSREDKGYSEKEEKLMEGIVHGNEQVMPEKSSSKMYLSKSAQNKFFGDYSIEQQGDYVYQVSREDGKPLNSDDEERLEKIFRRRGYSHVFVDMATPDENNAYKAHVGYPNEQLEIDEGFASIEEDGLTKKAVGRPAEWIKDKRFMGDQSPSGTSYYYMDESNYGLDRFSMYGLTFLLDNGMPEKVKHTSDGHLDKRNKLNEHAPSKEDVMRVMEEADMLQTPMGMIEYVIIDNVSDMDGFFIISPGIQVRIPPTASNLLDEGDQASMANKNNDTLEKIAEISGLSVGPTMMGTVWCPKSKEPVEEYLCWHICMEGIKTGEKIVCGKRLFDGLVADNNERALRRTTVFAHDNPDAAIQGPNYRIPDDERRAPLSDEEIPTERRLQELQKKFPVPHDTTEWTHSPTLSDDKKHDWSQKVKIAIKDKEAQATTASFIQPSYEITQKTVRDGYNDMLSFIKGIRRRNIETLDVGSAKALVNNWWRMWKIQANRVKNAKYKDGTPRRDIDHREVWREIDEELDAAADFDWRMVKDELTSIAHGFTENTANTNKCIKIASKKLLEKEVQAENDSFQQFLDNTVDTLRNNPDAPTQGYGDNYNGFVDKMIAAIPVDVQNGDVDFSKVLSVMDRLANQPSLLGWPGPTQEPIESIESMAQKLYDNVLVYMDRDLARQLVYEIISKHPRFSVLRKFFFEGKAAQKIYTFPDDAERYQQEVVEPRAKQLTRGEDERPFEYAERLMGIIAGDNLEHYTAEEAASLLAHTIPYPTNKQFIVVVKRIRDFMERHFGSNAMFYLANKWVNDVWDPRDGALSTNLTARRHIKNHFPEVIRMYSEFHPEHPEYPEDDAADFIDEINDKYPHVSPDDYPIV